MAKRVINALVSNYSFGNRNDRSIVNPVEIIYAGSWKKEVIEEIENTIKETFYFSKFLNIKKRNTIARARIKIVIHNT